MKYPLLGPVLWYDLVRTTRRGRHVLLRCGYLLFLLAAIFLLYEKHVSDQTRRGLFGASTLAPHEMAEFTDAFFSAFTMIQFFVILLITPIFTAGAIAEERERRTLEFLLATDLHNREIVFSKLLARLASLALLLLTGLPVLGLLQLLGGVDPDLVLGAFVGTALLMLTLASLGVLVSLYNRRTWDAVFRTYMIAGIGFFGTLFIGAFFRRQPLFNFGNPFIVLIDLDELVFRGSRDQTEVLIELLIGYVTFHALAVIVFNTWAVRRLRDVALRVPAPKDLEPVVHEPTRTRGDRPPPGDDALLWKEIHEEPIRWRGSNRAANACGILTLVAGLLFFLVLTLSLRARDRVEVLLIFPLIIGTIVAAFMLLLVALNGSGRFSREVERQTLETLLTVPERDRLLFSKWWASILYARGFMWVLAGCWAISLLTGRLNVLAVVCVVLGWFVYAAFTAAVGLFFSLLTRSTLRATVLTFLTLGAVILVNLVLVEYGNRLLFSRGGAEYRFIERVQQVGTAPPVTLGVLALAWADLERKQIDEYLAPALVGVAWYALLALGAWRLARQRFRLLITEPTVAETGAVPIRKPAPVS